jgi:hypothetical protein
MSFCSHKKSSCTQRKPRSRREGVKRRPPALVYCLKVLFALEEAMNDSTKLVKVIEDNGRKASRFLGLLLFHRYVAAKALESLNETSEHRIRTWPLDPDKLKLLLESEDVRVPLRTALKWMKVARMYPAFEDFQEVLGAKPPRKSLARSSGGGRADGLPPGHPIVEGSGLSAESAG